MLSPVPFAASESVKKMVCAPWCRQPASPCWGEPCPVALTSPVFATPGGNAHFPCDTEISGMVCKSLDICTTYRPGIGACLSPSQ